MKIASLHTAHLSANDEALLRCQTALDQKDKGDYEGAQDTMRRFWRGVGERPATEELHVSVEAEVLLCVGILTGWIGSKIQIKEAQETAKNLISESITYFESVGDQQKVAAARVELGYCYWRAGELHEARTMLREALKILTTEGNTRARALLKLTTVEWAAARYHEALGILTDNALLFQKLANHTVKGDYHSELAIVLRNLATAENKQEYFRRAIKEYEAADHHFKLAKNPVFRASVKNNVGFLLYKLARYKEAHKYLDEARRLTISFKDKARTAQIDETRAQVFIAEGKFKEAEAVARRAVSALDRAGHFCMMAEALLTQGIALARLGRTERAQFVFQRAIEVALRVNALNSAGLAALTLIEEVDQLSPATLQAAYQQAREWLAGSQSQDVLLRLNDAAGKLATSLRGELSTEEAAEILLTKPCDLQDRILRYERTMIKQALAQANGRVTHAASLLGLSYQGLCYIIATRHKDLLKERSPVRRRSRKGQ
ncbi:MAG: tetratricopeptide repeat protein [Acidobacteriota bacterium]|nr:tetratricopeptide repeat protein [Acidobacteriota bacterium]